ncbi:MAG: prepilin-type N-terminal cleavage/methylation domain-containing protein [Phycisphaerales bacterium]|nr:prepilin-type N-terminal cleavage/methylation domain-containing protein [Phycisphaerales bacterium]
MASASSPTQRRAIRRAGVRASSAFTLIELLLVVTIIAVLVSLLLPAIGGTIASARAFRCKSSQRTIAFDFQVFADDALHGSRGQDEVDLRPGYFRLVTFQDSQYQVNSFWGYGNASTAELPDANGRDPMRCPDVKGILKLRRGAPCTQGGVGPAENVSFGFNVRMHMSERYAAVGRNPHVGLTSKILEGNSKADPASIPLLMDVDGAAAVANGVSPLFAGPSVPGSTLLDNDRYWFPGLRHNGDMNIAFIDGHVESTHRPLQQRNWAWDFEAGEPVR